MMDPRCRVGWITSTDPGSMPEHGFPMSISAGTKTWSWTFTPDMGENSGNRGLDGRLEQSCIIIPGGGELDYAEAWFDLDYGPLTAGVAWTFWGEAEGAAAFDSGDVYYSLSLDLPLQLAQFEWSVFAGYYDFKEDGNALAGGELSYAHWGLSASRSLGQYGNLSLNYEQTDGGGNSGVATDDKPSFWLGWMMEF